MEQGNTTEVAETTEAVESTAKAEEKDLSFTELIQKPEYQKEFDKLVNKSINTAKANWEKDYNAKLEAQKTEAEKLAQMNAEQKMQYEIDKLTKENEALVAEKTANELYKTASDIAIDKDIPIGYLDLIDFSKEDADSITAKMQRLQEIRAKDLEGYISGKLQQDTPTERKEVTNKIDPYIEGFNAEFE